MEDKEILIAVIIGTIVLMALGAFFLFVIISYRIKKNRDILDRERMQREFDKVLQQSVAEVQETTFKTVGEELHDNVGQLLSSTKMLLGLTERNLANIPDTLIEANKTLATAIAELRSISKVLNKEWLAQFSFIENLKAELHRLRYSGTLKLNMNDDLIMPVNSEEQIILFRIVQEALNNVIKHSEAENVSVSLYDSYDTFTISIADDGKGFDTEARKNGVGLMNMKQRAKLVRGSLEIESSGKGSKIIIKLPKSNDIKN